MFALLASASRACTTFCMDTPDGPVCATNLDLFIPGDGLVLVNQRGIAKKNTRPNIDGETTKWTSQYGSVTFCLAGREYPWSGMNEAGLVVCTMELRGTEYPEPDERTPFDSGRWMQYVLDTCGNVPEAIRVNAVARLMDDADSPCHFLIADAEGRCAAIEYLDGELVCHRGNVMKVKAMTNMRYDRALAALERGGPRWWWSNPGQSAERFAGAAWRMDNFDPGGDTKAVDYALETLTDVVAAPHTRWNIVYDISKREVTFRSVQSPNVKSFSFDAFDFSCDAPVLMLDVNAALKGNVEEAFSAYDSETNLRVFSTFCARWGIEVSDKDAQGIMELFDGFDCAPEN